jgi:hypothetical protein
MQKVSSIEQLRPRASQERAGSQVCEFIFKQKVHRHFPNIYIRIIDTLHA